MSDNETIIERVAITDPLSFGIQHIDLLENKFWDVEGRKWIVDIYSSVNPYSVSLNQNEPRKLALMKPTQVGMSTMGLTKMLHFAYNWPVRTIYTLPRQQDVLDFVSTRVDPILKASPTLAAVLKEPDSTRAKGFKDSFIFFMELSIEPRMMPADALYFDEVDLSDQTNMLTALNRVDASVWKLIHYFGTPTIPQYGIDGLYNQSDKKEWFVKCPGCGFWQFLDWEKNLRVEGSNFNPSRVYFGCVRCSKELTKEYIQTGQWIAEKPSRSKEFTGFHISQMMTHTAKELYSHWIDPKSNITEFYRKRLGKPREIAGGSLTREDFLMNCFPEPYEFLKSRRQGAEYYMGVDQGNELQVVILEAEEGRQDVKTVLIEAVPFEKGFARVEQLMALFNIKRAVIDLEPNTHEVSKLVKRFPGRVLKGDYARISVRMKTLMNDPDLRAKGIPDTVVFNRTEAIDDIVEAVRRGWFKLPGSAEPMARMTEVLVEHFLGLKRDVLETRTPSGNSETMAVWRALGPDHFVHAMLYAKAAYETAAINSFRARLLGGKQGEVEFTEFAYSVNTSDEKPKEETKRVVIRIR